MKTADESPGLVFQWEGRLRTHWRLAGLIALSLLVHAIGFYVLQAAYTPTGSQLPPPVQVTMARAERADDPPATRAQARALAQWLTVTDPSLTTEPTLPAASGRKPGDFVEYVPSYKAAPPAFKPLDPPATGSAAPPRPRPPGPVPVVSANTPPPPAKPAPPTRVFLTHELAAMVSLPLPTIRFALPTGTKALNATTFLVGVRPGGGEPFVFREGSSGEVTADDYAQDYLARLSFQPPAGANGTTTWGWAAIHWGRDVYR